MRRHALAEFRLSIRPVTLGCDVLAMAGDGFRRTFRESPRSARSCAARRQPDACSGERRFPTDAAVTTEAASVKPDELPRRLGVASMAMLLVGITIGSGIFRVPSTVAGEIGSVGGVALVWLAGAAISLAGALPLVALVSALPKTGGAYVYIREGFGPLAAFLYGWIKLIVTGPAALAAIALIFAEYMRAFTPLTDVQVRLVAGALLIVLTVANVRSVNWSAWLQNASTVAKVLALAALSLVIFGRGDAAHGSFAQPIAWSGVATSGFWTALIAVLWTYTGWVDVTYVAGEVRDPGRTFPARDARRHGDRSRPVPARERRLPVRIADAGDGDIDSRRRDLGRAHDRVVGRGARRAARDGFDVRFAQRLDPDESPRILRACRRRSVFSVRRGRAPALQDALRGAGVVHGSGPRGGRDAHLRAVGANCSSSVFGRSTLSRLQRCSSYRGADRSSRSAVAAGGIPSCRSSFFSCPRPCSPTASSRGRSRRCSALESSLSAFLCTSRGEACGGEVEPLPRPPRWPTRWIDDPLRRRCRRKLFHSVLSRRRGERAA